jgi:hypothetical protein
VKCGDTTIQTYGIWVTFVQTALMLSAASIHILLKKIRSAFLENTSSLWDLILMSLGIPAQSFDNNDDKRIILYIGEFLPPRIARLAKWTKKTGDYTTVLLCYKEGYFAKFSNEGIDRTLLFRNKWHLKRIIKGIPTPYIVQGFAPKSKAPYLAMQFFKRYHPQTPFIGDYQDVLTTYYGTNPSKRWLKHELPYEKLCLEKADGIVAHSLEPCEGMKILKIKKKKNRIFFPLYCDNDTFKVPTLPFSSNNIHLVYAGGVAGSHRDKSHFGLIQFQWLIESLEKQKIHFHIYPSPTVDKADYAEYEQLAKTSEYFHFYNAVSQADLSNELSKYHYGVMPFFKEMSQQSDLKYKYATTLKLFNYSEAGIPILVGKSILYQSWLVDRYKLGIAVDNMDGFRDLRKIIEKQPYNLQVKQVLEGREKLSLKTHIPRLIQFYQKIRQK